MPVFAGEEIVTSRIVKLAILFALCAALVPMARVARAADNGQISGTIKDSNGQPWANITVAAGLEGKPETSATTDDTGKFKITGLAAGVYIISIKDASGQVIFQVKAKVAAGADTPADINFKDPAIAAASEKYKKENAEANKMNSLKAHFDAGNNALTQAKALEQQEKGLKGDDKAAIDAKLQPLSTQAVTEFTAALPLTAEKDNNHVIILEKLGESYDVGGKSEDAAKYYQQAMDLKPDAAVLNNLGNLYAKMGKMDEAKAAYEKSAETDPANAANAWRNFGITLYNANKLKDAVDPLRKATALDPNNAQTWYLLGAALVGAMDYKQEGDKITPIMQPGTVEAYQKCIELDPNGPWGQQAKEGLEQLKAMGVGIDTKVKGGKKN
jgi:tetratricopeptide (TPR) repeat protein